MHVDIIVEHTINFPCSMVWNIAKRFGELEKIHDGTISCKLLEGGTVRQLVTTKNALLWEKLIAFSEEKHILSYLIFDAKKYNDSPYGVGYIGEIMVIEKDEYSSIFSYRGKFDILSPFNEQEAKDAIFSFSKNCAQGIERIIKYNK